MVLDEYGILPLRLDSWFNCKVMEFGLEETLTNLYIWFMYGLLPILELFWEEFMMGFWCKISIER